MNDRAMPNKISKAGEIFWVGIFLFMAGFGLAVITANVIALVQGVPNLKPAIGLPVLILSFLTPSFCYFYLRTNRGKATLVAILSSRTARVMSGAIFAAGRFAQLAVIPKVFQILAALMKLVLGALAVLLITCIACIGIYLLISFPLIIIAVTLIILTVVVIRRSI